MRWRVRMISCSVTPAFTPQSDIPVSMLRERRPVWRHISGFDRFVDGGFAVGGGGSPPLVEGRLLVLCRIEWFRRRCRCHRLAPQGCFARPCSRLNLPTIVGAPVETGVELSRGRAGRPAMQRPIPLQVRLLGELQLVGADGKALALPASRKTRALLGYLIATGQVHRRERLCDLFWDGPDDPRAELRWSLSKIRALLGDGSRARLVADRERVGIELGDALVDHAVVRSLAASSVSAATTEVLTETVALFGGEFLDGLDLPLCYRYQEWCIAEREAMSQLRFRVLAALIARLEDVPTDALPYAYALVAADPLSETGHAAVVRLLGKMGRTNDALVHYERAHRIFEAELGAPPGEELKAARQALRPSPIAGARAAPSGTARRTLDDAPRPAASVPMVGRDAERATTDRLVGMAADGGQDVILVTGEPGVGKSHMLGYFSERVAAAGGRAFSARAFEAETARSYGIWIDLLRSVQRQRPRHGLPSVLGPLLPELGGGEGGVGDRTQLFDAIVDLLYGLAADEPVGIALDDVQWLDDASASLLHYVARRTEAAPGLVIACAARSGEVEDNIAVSRVLRSLARDGRLTEIELDTLSAEHTAELVRRLDPALDAAQIVAASDGNPLFALELARAHLRGDPGPGRTVKALIEGQLAGLTDQVRETLVWAAAHGRTFTPQDLARLGPFDAAGLLMALGELERRGLVRPAGGDAYDFTHDLVRQVTYRSLSHPRRKLLHRHIARALRPAAERGGDAAADLVHHAVLAEDDEMAARACIVAGERALRLFANAEAAGLAERGLRHVARLPEEPEKVVSRIALLKIRVLAATGPGLRSLPPIEDEIADATTAAEEQGLQAAAATGHYLLSILHQQAGQIEQAEASTLRAAEIGRNADHKIQAHQLANTARCLLELETEIARARELIAEAGDIAQSLGTELCELHWASGLLERWNGRQDQAAVHLARSLALARRSEDRWREYKCLTWLATLHFEMARYADMHARCEELRSVAERIGEETPFVDALQALTALMTADDAADEALESALARLRAADDKSYLAYALNSAASFYCRAGRMEQVRLHASEALTVASKIRRRCEIAIAKALLSAAANGSSAAEVDDDCRAPIELEDFSARARAVLRQPAEPARSVPTAAPTPGLQT
ncbi:MAG: ATP-binding protein [Mesorhizobium sp.]|nr:MAG: ATP-binding protein [Mesorhizobium sp.]